MLFFHIYLAGIPLALAVFLAVSRSRERWVRIESYLCALSWPLVAGLAAFAIADFFFSVRRAGTA